MFTLKTAFHRAVTSSVALWAVVAYCAASATSQAQPAPPNDNLARPQFLVGISGTVTATNLSATVEPLESTVWPFTNQAPQSTIWFEWTAPISGEFDFNTRGSTDPYGNQLQTVLAVYKLTKGTNVSYTNLTVVANNEIDPSETNVMGEGIKASRVDFPATLETTYFIQVDGASFQGTNGQGYIILNWGNSLVAGAFGFSTSVFICGSLDDMVPYGNDSPRLTAEIPDQTTVNPSLHNPSGSNNVRITVTRAAPAVGRCEVAFNLGTSYYTNLYYTNYVWTNIFAINTPTNGPPTFTNTFTTNIASVNLFENDENGQYTYLPVDADVDWLITNANGQVFGLVTNLPIGSLGLNNGYNFTILSTVTNNPPLGSGVVPNFFTNFPSEFFGTCPVLFGSGAGQTSNSDGSVTFYQTNIGCSVAFTNSIVPAANQFNYADLSTNLIFDDFQNSLDVYIMVNPSLSLFMPGPEDPGFSPDPNYSYPGLNTVLSVTLTNAVLDPLEDPDIVPPTISQPVALVNELNITGDPSPQFTNGAPTAISVNIERATFRCNKDTGVVILSVQRFPIGAGEGTMVHYTIDSGRVSQGVGVPAIPVDNNNRFLTAAQSDYATPYLYTNQPLWDYMLPTNDTWTGTYGTLTWAAYDADPKLIQIPLTNNGAVEFDSDLLVQIFLLAVGPDEITPALMQTPLPVVVGNINQATLTINFNNTSNVVEPGGAVDRTYNVDGQNVSFPPNNPVPGADQQVGAVAIQPTDGKAVIGGDFNSFDSTNANFVTRLQVNGQPDLAFIDTMGSGPNGPVNAVAIDPSGKIVIGGYFTSINGTNANHIARLNIDGSLDTTFKTGFGFNDNVWALQIDANSNIVVGGDFTSFNTTNANHIARLIPSGGLDDTFLPNSGLAGYGTDNSVLALALDSLGNIILGGKFISVNGTNWNHVARLLTNGVVDGSFNPGTAADQDVYAVGVQANNQIILGGAFQNYNGQIAGSVARLNVNGSYDTSFATGSGANDVVFSVVVQPDQNILIAGQFTSVDGVRRVGMARLLSTGWVDTSFMDTAYNQFAGLINNYYNTNAYNPSDYPNPYNYRNAVYAMGLQADNNIVIGGSFERVGGGFTRNDIHTEVNVARIIGGATTGPENGGIGNDPGNITLAPTYAVDDTANNLFVTLDRVNGSLGPAVVTLGTNTLAPGPGSASQKDFGLLAADTSLFNDVWQHWEVTAPGWGWRESDGYYGYNNKIQPTDDFKDSALNVTIHNDQAALDNLYAGLQLLNLNSANLLTLGGVPIPTYPALGIPSAPLQIIDDNEQGGTFGFGSTNFVVVNTAGYVTVTVVRTNGIFGTVRMNYKTSNGGPPGTNTAVGGPSGNNTVDYVTTVGSLQFQPEQTTATFTIPIVDHSTVQSTKAFTITLYGVTGSANSPAYLDTNAPPLVPSTAVITIIDGNFQPGHLEFSSPTYSVTKGGTATVSVTRIGGALGTLTVQAGTLNLTATNGLNYVGVTNTLTFTNQQITPDTFTVSTLQDNLVEGAKTVELSLFNPIVVGSTGTLSNSQVLAYPSNAVLTINDADAYGTIGFLSPNFEVAQNAGVALITVTRNGGSVGTVSVNYSTSNGGTNIQPPYQPALAGTNYGATSGVLTFGPNVTAQTFTVPIYVSSTETPANRVFNLTLFGNSSNIATQFPKTAMVTILDPALQINGAGSVDQTTLNGAGFNDYVTSLSVQPDGSILAGGNFTYFNNYQFNGVGRLLPDGAYDFSFLQNQSGADGPVWQVLSQVPVQGQTNGPIMVVGAFTNFDRVNRGGIARLNIDGSLDETFNPGAGADNTIYSIAQMFLPSAQTNQAPSLYYIIGGQFANYNGIYSSGVARITTNGALDPTFNVGSGASGEDATVHVVAVQPNNQILVGGDFQTFNNVAHHHLVRLNPDGSIDPTFPKFDGTTNNGLVSDINGSVRSIVVQPDSRILIGGLFTSVNGSNYNYIARLNADGTLDTNFDNTEGGCNAPVLAIALDSQTRIMVGGQFTQANGVTRNGLTRMTTSGTVDPTINFGLGANGYIDTIVVQTNDEIDVGGGFTTFNNIPENNFARLFGDANVGEGAIEFTQQTFGVMDTGTNALITIERVGGEGTAAEPNVTNTFITYDGTARNGTNYIGVTNTVVFKYGETFQSVEVPVIDTGVLVGNLTVNLALTNPIYAALGPQSTAQLIITNSVTALAFSTNAYRQTANVASGSALIPVVRIGNPNSLATVTVETVPGGTATAGTNYIATTNTLIFYPGVLTNYFLVGLLNAPDMFSDETVNLELINWSNAEPASPTNAVLTIANVYTAPGVIAFAQSNYTALENAGFAYVTLVRTNGYSGPVSVTLSTSNGTAMAGISYTPVTTNVFWADGDYSPKTIPIPIMQLSNAGPSLTVLLNLSNPQGGATLAGPTQEVLTIENDIPDVSFVNATSLVTEGSGQNSIFIQRYGPSNSAATVSYSTYTPPGANETNGYAVPGVDYVPTAGTVTFGPGVMLESIPVTILQGTGVNGLLTFNIILSNPQPYPGVQIGYPGTNTVGIVSDVAGFSFATNNYYVGENATNVAITIDRLNPGTGTVLVNVITSDGSAVNGVDYISTNLLLTFTNGLPSETFTIPILNPGLVESNKSFTVSLSIPLSQTNALVIAPSNTTVTITNVYTGVSFGSPTLSVSECAGQATVPVYLSGLTNGTVTVQYFTQDGSAQSNVNYLEASGALTFLPGQTTQSFNVPVINNHIIGPNHSLVLELTNVSPNAQLLAPDLTILTIDECNGSDIVPSGTAWVSGNPDNGVIYPGDQVTILFGLHDISGGNTANLVATLLPTNGVTNVTTGPQSYGVLVQGGPTVSRAFTFTAVGTNGQNISATFALQDGSRTLSNVVFGLTLGGTSLSFTNSEALLLPENAQITRATNSYLPYYGYPSAIPVSGVVGNGSAPANVTSVSVTLTNFGHTFPQNADIVLESPSGQASILMSHAGGGNSISKTTLTFSESANTMLPTTGGAIVSGTYLPTTNTLEMPPLPIVQYPTPGVPSVPAGYPYGANLSYLTGGTPNGDWLLWAIDEDTGDSGYISNGWILNLTIGTPIESDSDLEVAVNSYPTSGTLSNTLTYSVTVTNFGPAEATNVIVTDLLPAGATYEGSSLSDVTQNGNTISALLGKLPIGSGTSFNVQVIPTALGYLTNVMIVLANEPNPNSNYMVTNINLISQPSADVGINLSGAPNPALVGGTVTFSVVVTNGGPSSALGTVATDVLPPGFSVTSLSPSTGTANNSNGTITWDIGTLGYNATATLSIVTEALMAQTGLNSVSITSSSYDPYKLNNFAAVKTEVDQVQFTLNKSGGVYTLSWPTGANNYVLQGTTNLPPLGKWTDINATIPTSGGFYNYTLPGNTGDRFFRLSAQVP